MSTPYERSTNSTAPDKMMANEFRASLRLAAGIIMANAFVSPEAKLAAGSHIENMFGSLDTAEAKLRQEIPGPVSDPAAELDFPIDPRQLMHGLKLGKQYPETESEYGMVELHDRLQEVVNSPVAVDEMSAPEVSKDGMPSMEVMGNAPVQMPPYA